METPEFKWDGYLQHTNSESAPEIAFAHVEHSLESLFQVDTVIEIVSKCEELQLSPLKGKRKKSPSAALSTTYYWPATIIMSCNPLLLVRFVGYTHSKHDKWIDPFKHEFHPLNWTRENGRSLSPPDDLKEMVGPDINAYLNHHLKDMKSISHDLLELGKMGTCPIDFIKADDTLEVQDEQDLNVVWIAKVIKNMGGRLHLRYLGAKSSEQDFWLFYLSSRIHYPNWAQKKNIPYKYPKGIMKTPEVDLLLAHILKEKSTIPTIIFKPQNDIPLNTRFEVGMGLEILWRNNPTQVYPGIVSKVQSYQHFQIQLLNEQRTLLSCHCGMSNILRANWASDYDMPFKKPYGNFSWENYGKERGKGIPPSSYLPTIKKCENPGFEVDMKLECIHPLKSNELYVATIRKVVEPLMLLEFDSTQEKFLFPIDSQELFPMGWGFTNNCPLFAPKWERPISPPISAAVTQAVFTQTALPATISNGSNERPNEDRLTSLILHINSRCFSGNNLNKGKLSVLPKQFGPGKMSLVLSEAITRIINVGYKPSSLLKDILEHKWSSHFETEKKRITIKCSGKSHEGLITLVRNPDQIEDYCKEFCSSFNCCPFLFGPQTPTEECFERCSKYKKSKFGQALRKSSRKGLKRGPKPIAVKKEDTSMVESKKENISALPEPSRMVTRQSGNLPPSKFNSLVEKYQAKRDIPKVNKFSWHKQKFNKTSNVMTPVPAPRGRPKGSTKRLSSEENLPPVPKLPSNPIDWSVDDAYDYILTTKAAPMAHWFKDNLFDGKALLTITKPQLCRYYNFNERGYELINETVMHIWLSYYLHYANHKFQIQH